MKISKLHIDSHKHLENLTLDFTYQSGERKGQPLDKICFIGQSASGKTSLLEIIYEASKYALNLEIINGNHLHFNKRANGLNGEIEFLIAGSLFLQKSDEIFYKNKSYKDTNSGGTVTSLIPNNIKSDVFYFKANLISDKNFELLATNPIDLIEKHKLELEYIEKNFKYKETYGMLFDYDVKNEVWLFLVNQILEYRRKYNQKISELIHQGLLNDTKKLNVEYSKWQKNNPNVLEQFAQKLNPIFSKLHIEVDLINTEYSIPIKNKRSDEIIPIQNISTGTKGLLLSFLPLYKLDTKDSIILIDEPERSLYPDMQMDIMEHYKNFAPDAQFIVATHSPFIAASFEPDERFILEFNQEGKVTVRRGSSPIGDDPNDMLYNDFGINYVNKYGQQKHQEYLELKQKIHFETDSKKKEEISEQLEKLGEEYNF